MPSGGVRQPRVALVAIREWKQEERKILQSCRYPRSSVSPLFTASGQNTEFRLPVWQNEALLRMFWGDKYKAQMQSSRREATHGWGWSCNLARCTLTLCDVTGGKLLALFLNHSN